MKVTYLMPTGCKYSGYIDSHPNQEEGAVPRLMRFPGIEKTQPIEVENCGDGRSVFISNFASVLSWKLPNFYGI